MAEKYTPARSLSQILCSFGTGSGTIEANPAAKTITDATNATPIVVTSNAHGYTNGDYVFIQDVTGNTAANGLFKLANVAANTFELTTSEGVDVAGNGAYGANGTALLCVLIKPAATETYELTRMNGIMGDSKHKLNEYMDIAKLTNGILVQVRNTSGAVATLTPTPIKISQDWSLATGGVDNPTIDTTTGDAAGFRWTFNKYGPRILLRGAAGEFLVVLIQDALDGLVYQRFAVEGESV